MIKFLFSRSASWSVLLVSSLLLTSCRSALFPAVVALLPAVGPLFYFLLLQPPELFVISFSSLPGCTSCTRFAVGTALAGAWWSVRHPRLSHAFTDRPVCVSGADISALPCPLLPSSMHVRRHGRRSRIPIARPCCKVLSVLLPSSCSCHCCRFTALSPAVYLAFGVLTCSARRLTRPTQAFLLDIVLPT